MARRTVRIPIPIGHPEKYVTLIEDIWKKHIELGASSPLLNNPLVDMAGFETLMNEALSKRAQAIEYMELAHGLMGEARKVLGVTQGQTSFTEGTLYYHVVGIKKFLAMKHRDLEQNMEGWGFHVVVGTAKKPVRKKKKP